MKTTALLLSDSCIPHFYFISDLFNMNAPVTEIVYKILSYTLQPYYVQINALIKKKIPQ